VTTRRRCTKLPCLTPKTIAEGESGSASVTSWIGAASSTPGCARTRSTRDSGRTDAVGSATPPDAVIHIDETRAVEPLERTAGWELGEPPETYPTAL